MPETVNTQDELKYLLDGTPITFRELIDRATSYGYGSGNWLLTTSGAAICLREQGHTVGSNPNWSPTDA